MKRGLSKLEEFLAADYERQFELLNDPETRSSAQMWMGTEAFSEFVSFRPDLAHLGTGPKNIVFVPGVMGSTLESKGLGGVWWLDLLRARDKLNDLKLTADGEQDIDQDAEIVSGAVDLSYVPFRRALATSDRFGGSVPFPYDWRKPIRLSANALRDTIVQTFREYGRPVHLIGHSMGGLLLRATLMIHGKDLWPITDRIVFIGTPHYGSPSIAGYLKNHLWGWEDVAILGLFLSRETFRTLRGVLSLLPAPTGIYPGARNGEEHPCANFEMYDAQDWGLELDAAATAHLQNVLDEVHQFHTDLHNWHDSLLQEHKERMLVIAGVGQETLFRLEFDTTLWALWERTRKITSRLPCQPHREGDGRVPVASACLEDVTVRYVMGVHGGLPNIPGVAREALSWLTGGVLNLSETCDGALSAHLSTLDDTSIAPSLDGSEGDSRFRDLPEYDHATPELVSRVTAELEAGHRPGINLVKIL